MTGRLGRQGDDLLSYFLFLIGRSQHFIHLFIYFTRPFVRDSTRGGIWTFAVLNNLYGESKTWKISHDSFSGADWSAYAPSPIHHRPTESEKWLTERDDVLLPMYTQHGPFIPHSERL